jgi:hypothetical protein
MLKIKHWLLVMLLGILTLSALFLLYVVIVILYFAVVLIG